MRCRFTKKTLSKLLFHADLRTGINNTIPIWVYLFITTTLY